MINRFIKYGSRKIESVRRTIRQTMEERAIKDKDVILISQGAGWILDDFSDSNHRQAPYKSKCTSH